MDLAVAIVQRERREASRRRAWDTGMAQSAPSAGWVSVNCSGAVEQVWCPAGITPAAGDVVAVLRAGTPIVAGILAAGDADNPDLGPSAPQEAATSGVASFPALYTFSWQADPAYDGTNSPYRQFGYVTSVRQGDPGDGAWRGIWYYQQTPTVLAGATVDSVRMRLHRLPGGPAAAAAHLYTTYDGYWPPLAGDAHGPDWPSPDAGPVDVAMDPTAIVWADLPATWGQDMVDADPRPAWGELRGVMLYGDTPVISMYGVDTDPLSGLLEITWHR